MSNSVEKSRKTSEKMSFIQIKSSISEPKKLPKIKQKTVKCSFAEEENNVYVSQLQELARYFSSIENSGIRQYGINLMRELSKCESEERARMYAEEVMS